MSRTEIMKNVSARFARVGLTLKKHSPEIMLVAGSVGVVASGVMACKATLKVNDILDGAKDTIEKIHEVAENPEHAEEYTPEDAKKDIAIVYAQTGLKFVKLYGPAVVLGAASLACLIKSNDILRKRNIALAAAYMTEHTGFKEYRDRLIERFGEELDRELKYNIKTEKIETVVTNEDGTESVIEEVVEVPTINMGSQYSRFFDDGCLGWEKNAELNLFRVLQVQNWANETIQSRARFSKDRRGFMFLNEVYDEFGIPRTAAGQMVGWVYDEANPIGDNVIDFGVFDKDNVEKRRFVNGKERVILLDFNVDGVIHNLI